MNVTLKKWTLEDAEALMEIANNVCRNYLSNRLPYPYTKADADWWLNMVREQDGKEGIFRAVMLDDRIVGNISIEKKSDVYEKDAEIGYMLSESVKGRGIMTEAAKQICEIAFHEFDLLRITGLVYQPNIASQRVLEKSGFVLEGMMKDAVYKNGQVYDLCIYGRTRS